MADFRQAFLGFSLARDVLRFGEFVTKAGRRSPYFFNAGLFDDGESLRRLGQFYADALLASGIAFDQLFGPAYKGITLAAATARLTSSSLPREICAHTSSVAGLMTSKLLGLTGSTHLPLI